MKLRRFAYVLMTFSFILIVSGSVSSFLLGLKADKDSTYKRMDTVSDSFETFSTNVSAFEDMRDELYNSVLSNKLDKLCEDVYYPESSINNKCINYKSIYEQVVNYFVTDINIYNKNIVNYNNYQASLGSGLLLKSYDTNKKFIDYNKDGSYDGKED